MVCVFPPAEDMTIVIGTKKCTRKVEEIKANPKCSLLFYDKESICQVIFEGKAFVDNNIDKEKYWRKEWNEFYENKEKDYVLLKFIPSTINITSIEKGIASHPLAWKPVILQKKNNGQWEMDTVQGYNLSKL